jgi:hypothetical protein
LAHLDDDRWVGIEEELELDIDVRETGQLR